MAPGDHEHAALDDVRRAIDDAGGVLRFDKFVDSIFGIGNAPGSNNAVESRKRVASRAGANAQDIGATFG